MKQVSYIVSSDVHVTRKNTLCLELIYGKDSDVVKKAMIRELDPLIDKKTKDEANLEVMRLIELMRRQLEHQLGLEQLERHLEMEQPPNI